MDKNDIIKIARVIKDVAKEREESWNPIRMEYDKDIGTLCAEICSINEQPKEFAYILVLAFNDWNSILGWTDEVLKEEKASKNCPEIQKNFELI
jgi:hypothetical protein